MAGPVETLTTDLFRDHHRAIARELHEIEQELERVQQEKRTWRTAAPAFRRLLVLGEVDIEPLTEEEEHRLYAPLRQTAGGLSPTLAACYDEHRDIRLRIEALHHDLLLAYSGHEPRPDELVGRAGELIALVRDHMAREDSVLFLAAEQELPREVLTATGGLVSRAHTP